LQAPFLVGGELKEAACGLWRWCLHHLLWPWCQMVKVLAVQRVVNIHNRQLLLVLN
jgi:hypothetical protein